MPELLGDQLPERFSRSRTDFSAWADGQVWKFVKGEDYQSSTDSFRYSVRRWAKANGYAAECRPFLAEDGDGNPIPATKADPIALAVRLARVSGA